MENTSNTQHGERAEGWPALPMADAAVAFPTLDDSELAVLEALGTVFILFSFIHWNSSLRRVRWVGPHVAHRLAPLGACAPQQFVLMPSAPFESVEQTAWCLSRYLAVD